MSDTTTITPEERAALRSENAPVNGIWPCAESVTITRLLTDLEQAEAHAEKTEAENAQLNKMVEWFAYKMADTLSTDEDGRDVLTCPSRTLRPVDHNCDHITCQQCWAEAARRAVADESEVK